ncbi:uncharacterized protein Z518_04585 [Rhinocladiella mackenziei CBS 650.93]|uniref:Cupin 2 conserved barrel domain-containing protein n=1 Tax=Rhinocladiella mackenziei CBS 650.93 TaxID=1442369 RepID=A0A0D2ILJ8_9EURO|nr:uncharacterized protein Z518_04585 [Rhinocladiella mackenziei CBS 650.93]KIX06609.1 hypothetical protein Z518_04585 [Rhinocladiella mackenziei CBS 650.93]
MQPHPHLRPTRRLVTGHSPDGKAIFESDDKVIPVNPTPAPASDTPEDEQTALPVGITLIHRTENCPVKIQGSRNELNVENLRRGQGEKGVVRQIIDLPPTSQDKPLYLHRNQSLDYGVVLKGSMNIILDDGEEETLREGDVYVQK